MSVTQIRKFLWLIGRSKLLDKLFFLVTFLVFPFGKILYNESLYGSLRSEDKEHRK